MRFAFYVQQKGKPREKKFELDFGQTPDELVRRVVWELETMFNTYTDTRVHIEQVFTQANIELPPWDR